MDIKVVKLKKGMSKEEVNELISEWLLLEDDLYIGNTHKHNWRCKCGNLIEGKMWGIIRGGGNSTLCNVCKYNIREQHYKEEVEKTGEYEYIRSFRMRDILPNGRVVGDYPYIQVKHKYCGSIYEVKSTSFINNNQRCGKCCGSYENSFAHFIEVELGLKLEDVWDFEKNTLNPYYISKNAHNIVFIKCRDIKYHESYNILQSNFIRSVNKNNKFGCPYCHGKKVHSKDSFAQYHIDNTDQDFLEKYWDFEKNTVSPWEITPRSNKNKVWIKCNKKLYHKSYCVICTNFTESTINKKNSNLLCPYCSSNKVHPLDSFGYHHFDKVMSWHPDNEVSPFRVSRSNGKKYKFICYECGKSFKRRISDLNRDRMEVTCSECSKSQGEKRIIETLRYNKIKYISEKEFKGLVGLKGKNLRYDFYLSDYNILIEYDGELHYHDKLGNDL